MNKQQIEVTIYSTTKQVIWEQYKILIIIYYSDLAYKLNADSLTLK